MKERIKILFLDHTPFIGGAQLSLLLHLRSLNQDKFEIIVGCSGQASALGLLKDYEKIGLKYYFLPFAQLKKFRPKVLFELFRSVKAVAMIIKKEQIDIVFGNTVRADIIASLAAFITRKKSIWFIQDYTFFRFFYFMLKWQPSKILFVSYSIAKFYSAKIDERKYRIIHIWRSIHKEIQKINKQEIIDNRLKIIENKDDFIVGYIGRLVNDKGPQILIEAMDLILQKGIKNIKCVIIGTGANQEGNNELFLRNFVVEKGLSDFITFTGYQKNIPLFLTSLDALCLTTIKPEPFSSVVIEAMMARVPVIATNTGGTPEIIKNKKTGILVEADNSKELSDAILEIKNNQSMRSEIIKNSHDYVMKYNTSEFKTRELEEIYLEVFIT